MMKRSRKELKAIAKRALLGNYGTVVGSILLSILILFAMAIPIVVVFFLAALRDSAIIMIVGMLIWYLLMILVSALFTIGTTRICYQVCIGQEARLGDMLYAFKNHPFRFLGLSIIIGLLSLLGSAPGFILMLWSDYALTGVAGTVVYLVGFVVASLLSIAITLHYCMAVYVLIEEPWRTIGVCMQLSGEMTYGNKLRLFQLQISFLGMHLLSYMTFGLGSLWVTPYITSTMLCCYLSIKEEKYARTPEPYVPEEEIKAE